ncbi:hypothetical protein QJQ45_028610 [Haematococcus lacustris]|nr:hypothetical protein QJQ45_028610 [Haematococcus lacustris]
MGKTQKGAVSSLSAIEVREHRSSNASSSQAGYETCGGLLRQAELQGIEPKTRLAKDELVYAHLQRCAPLFLRRAELVNGSCEPTEEELRGCEVTLTKGGNQNGPPAGVPGFWYHAMKADPVVGPHLHPQDTRALLHLTDIRYVQGPFGTWVEFHFDDDNPCFENTVLRRGLSYIRDDKGQLVSAAEETTDIIWRHGCNLLVTSTRSPVTSDGPRPPVHSVPSFFRFFTPLTPRQVGKGAADTTWDPTAADSGDEADAEGDDDGLDNEQGAGGPDGLQDQTAARRAHDMLLLSALVKNVIPRAVELYLQAVQAAGSSPTSTTPASGQANDDTEEEEEEVSEEGFQLVAGRTAGRHLAPGGLAAAPASVQRVVHALSGLHAQVEQLMVQLRQGEWQVLQQADASSRALAQRRAQLLARTPVRIATPCWPTTGTTDALAPSSGGSSGGGSHDGDSCTDEPHQLLTTTPPLFWLRALKATDIGCLTVSSRDELALAALADVAVEWDWQHVPSPQEAWRKCTVRWRFLDNPFFGPATLRLAYTFNCVGGNEHTLTLTGPGEVLDAPVWLPVDLHAVEAEAGQPNAAQQPGGSRMAEGACKVEATDEGLSLERGGAAAAGTLTPSGGRDLTLRDGAPCTSFFNRFKPGHLQHAWPLPHHTRQDPGRAAVQALEHEEALLAALLGPLHLNPVELYHQVDLEAEDLAHPDDVDEDEDIEYSGEEEEEEEGSPTASARVAQQTRNKAGRGQTESVSSGFKYSWVFMGVMVSILVLQLLTFLDSMRRGPRKLEG